MNLKFIILFLLVTCSLKSQTPQWRTLPNSPLAGNRFDDVEFTDLNNGYIIDGAAGRMFKTTNAGNSWDTLLNINNSSFRSLGFFDSNTGIVGTLNLDTSKLMMRTTNAGANWDYVNNFGGARPLGICGISIVNSDLAYACGRYSGPGKVIKTTNKGASWSIVLDDSSLATNLIDCYFWSPDSGIVVGGHGSVWTLTYSAVLLTTNGGQSWQRVYKSNRISEYCWKISFVSKETGFVSIERSSYILKTTNSGLNWTEQFAVSGYLQQGIGFLNNNLGWLGGSNTAQVTTNGGTSWADAGWGRRLNRIIFQNDTLGYAAGQRIYKYSITPPVSINQTGIETPSNFMLHQNYPNPFNPNTAINYELPNANYIRLTVYDALGNEVDELVNEVQSAGRYEVEFDGSNLSSGIYFYKFESGDFIETRRMILLK